jgi:8-oxo-dGTP pyrophosphatase MutT (NUDIX family)
MVRTRGRDRFYLPGGKPEPGEDDGAALQRELDEELGVMLDVGSMVRVATVIDVAHGWPDGARVRMRCYRARVVGTPIPCGEIAEAAWLVAADRARCAPAAQQIVDWLSGRARHGMRVE